MNKELWEKEFDKEFAEVIPFPIATTATSIGEDGIEFKEGVDIYDIKAFIKEKLEQQKKEYEERLERAFQIIPDEME